jgi:DNA-binding transcriptional LysR family regulator
LLLPSVFDCELGGDGRVAPAPLHVNVLYPHNRHVSAKVRAFVDWTAALFAASALTQRR